MWRVDGACRRTAFAFGAELIEVRVHKITREIRTPRVVGAFAAGRIVNERTARSQLMGGMIWGISSALHEATEIDNRAARCTNMDLAEYMIPVNADVPEVDVLILPEQDTKVNALASKASENSVTSEPTLRWRMRSITQPG
jgi:xanthine dehydrogenase YagR molybdenum-binding subunit